MFVSFVTCYFSPVTWHLPCLAYFLSYVRFYWEQRLPSSNLYATLTPTQTPTSQHIDSIGIGAKIKKSLV